MASKIPSKRGTGNRQQVLEVLQNGGRPLSAYELLDRLRAVGIKAPPTVYRALNQLIDQGYVHRLESVNAYVACSRRHCDGSVAFAICEDCGAVTEFEAPELACTIQGWATRTRFRVERTTVELHGYCQDCQGRDPHP